MAELKWDSPGERQYETGVDKGVLWLDNFTGIPWNGLTNANVKSDGGVVEKSYQNGRKLYEQITGENVSGSLTSIGKPEEFSECEGFAEPLSGLLVGQQEKRQFHLSYRTKIGNDISGQDFGHRYHFLYDAMVVRQPARRETVGGTNPLTQFSWQIVTIPQNVEGHKPTAYMAFDSTEMNKYALKDLEKVIFGSDLFDPVLPSIDQLVDILRDYVYILLTDHGDGTWSAKGPSDLIQMVDDTTFVISDVMGLYLDEYTYQIIDTGLEE